MIQLVRLNGYVLHGRRPCSGRGLKKPVKAQLQPLSIVGASETTDQRNSADQEINSGDHGAETSASSEPQDLCSGGKRRSGSDEIVDNAIAHRDYKSPAELLISTPFELDVFVSLRDHEDALSSLLRTSHSLSSIWTVDDKIRWLRSQVIGHDLEFETPFGLRRVLYADHTASGRSLLFIENFIIRHVLPYYGNTHTEDSFVGRQTSRMVRESEEYIKRRLGGGDGDALLFCGSGCTAAIKRLQEVMGIAVPSTLRTSIRYSMMREEDRWVVFTGPYEHHSNLLSWRQSLADVVEIPAGEDGCIDMAALDAALQSPLYSRRRLKLGSFSACSNVTGLVTDTRAIACLLHKHGAFACFDFAAGAPHVEIDMRSGDEDGYDALVVSPHKLLGGPGTPGLLLMKHGLYMLGQSPPSTCGGGTVRYVNGFDEQDTLYHERVEDREDGGTPPIVQKIRCALAFWVKDGLMGTELIGRRESYFIQKAITRLSANANIEILGPKETKRAPILSFLVKPMIDVDNTMSLLHNLAKRKLNCIQTPVHDKITLPLHGRLVVRLLNDLYGIQARGGCACAGPYGHTLLGIEQEQSLAIRSAIEKGYEAMKPGWTRVSLSYDMSEEEADYLLSAIDFLARHAHRFLAARLYNLNWHTGQWSPATSRIQDLLLTYSHQIREDKNGDWLPRGDTDWLPNGMVTQRQRFNRWLKLAKALAHKLPSVVNSSMHDEDILVGAPPPLFRVR